MNYLKQCLVKPGAKIKLADIKPDFTDCDEKSAIKQTNENNERIRDLQELLYAEHKRSLLICLQAIDSGGKDGVIRHVLGSMNPQGCRVISFKEPTALEQDHDALWRMHRDVPALGEVAIFNRSHYETILIERVHNLVPKKEWSRRYKQINDMEKILSQSHTHIIKFFLHISKDEQLERFKARMEDPTKQWKVRASDYKEREYWDEYQQAFNAMLSKCSTEHAPWFIIPANNKWFRNLAVSQIIVEYMEGLNMKFPPPPADIEKIKKDFIKAKAGK